MAEIIPIRKPPTEPLYFLHECKNGYFMLRDDGEIVCKKCGKVIEWDNRKGWA